MFSGDIFHSARLKLTLWYLVILMAISIVFSLLIFRVEDGEATRSFSLARLRIERNFGPNTSHALLDESLLSEARERFALQLFALNFLIILVGGGGAYFLAGRTLKPIAEAVEEQKRFVSDASHELRTPLTALRSEIEVALRNKKITSDEAKEILESNLAEVIKLQKFSDRLLTLARLDSSGQKANLVELNLAEVLEKAVKKVQSLAKAKKIDLSLSESENFKVRGDEESLVELFTILLDNAIKYSPSGSKANLSTAVDGANVAIKVTDQGKGIAEADLPHIFERFWRADKARAENGFGLGLSIAKKIVDEHSGTIGADSNLGEGTTFTIRLPLAKS